MPDALKELAAEKKAEMVERLAEVDDEIAELFLGEEVRCAFFSHIWGIFGV